MLPAVSSGEDDDAGFLQVEAEEGRSRSGAEREAWDRRDVAGGRRTAGRVLFQHMKYNCAWAVDPQICRSGCRKKQCQTRATSSY